MLTLDNTCPPAACESEKNHEGELASINLLFITHQV